MKVVFVVRAFDSVESEVWQLESDRKWEEMWDFFRTVDDKAKKAPQR